MVEIVSPGNKNNHNGLKVRAEGPRSARGRDSFAAGRSVSASARDPRGIHGAVWGEDCGEDYALPADKPLTCVAYVGGAGPEAFIEPVAVGDALPEHAAVS